MFKKKLIIVVLLLALLMTVLMAGCAGGAPSFGQPADPPKIETLPDSETGSPESQPSFDFTEGLTRDEYPGIVMSADVLERMAFLPGMAVPVTVIIENKGDKSVYYVQGSGSFDTPQALFLRSEDLQPIIPRDQLGIMTMDFVVEKLEPGDILRFKMFVMAIQPNISFNEYTFNLFNENVYIADTEWPELQKQFSDLVAVKPGNYTASAFFLYAVLDTESNGDGQPDVFDGPTGYAMADCTISIS
jgi:hypothetical protein